MKKSLLSILVILVIATPIHAQQQENQPAYNLSNPFQTINTHLRYLQDNNFRPDISAKAFNPEKYSPQEAEDLALKLKQVIDGKGHLIDMTEIPRDSNYLDSASNRHIYIFWPDYPDMFLEKVNGSWVYSGRTAIVTNQLHEEIFPFGTFDKLGGEKYFGLYYWQYLGILILVFAAFLIHKLLTYIIHKLITGVLFRTGYKQIAQNFVLPVARPISLFLVFLLLKVTVPMLQLPIGIGRYLILSINALLPFFATLVFYKAVDLLSLYFEKLASRTESTLDDQLVPLFRKVMKTFVVIIGGLFVLQNLEIQILPLLAGLSIGGLAFALAAQDTVKNFFGSLMIFIDKPFQIGDWITSGEIDGTVEEVGARSTRIRTFRNSVIYVPNGNFANANIDNHGLRVYRRFYTTISIMYDTPPDIIETFVNGLKDIVMAHPNTSKEKYEIHLNDMGASSLNIMFYIFFSVPTWSDELKARHEIILKIIQLAKELGVQFAFPTQTLHIENMPGQESLSPVYMSKEEAENKLKSFLAKGEK